MVTLMKIEAKLVFPSSNKLKSEELHEEPSVYSSERSRDVGEVRRSWIWTDADGLSASQIKDAAKLR